MSWLFISFCHISRVYRTKPHPWPLNNVCFAVDPAPSLCTSYLSSYLAYKCWIPLVPFCWTLDGHYVLKFGWSGNWGRWLTTSIPTVMNPNPRTSIHRTRTRNMPQLLCLRISSLVHCISRVVEWTWLAKGGGEKWPDNRPSLLPARLFGLFASKLL